MEDYEYVSTLGEGAYGVVWKCRARDTGRVVAIKSFKEAHLYPEIKKLALREVRILRSLDHPAVVPLLDAFKSKSGRVYMVFPYIGHSAFQALDDHPNGLPSRTLKLLAWQLLHSLDYLHGIKVVHRDVKPANILMSEDGGAVLCDFGFARKTHCTARDSQALSPYVVTRWYRSPEVLLAQDYGPATDIWSLGCTLAELTTGLPLFQEVLLAQDYGPATDIWSLGCTLAELTTGLPLFQGTSTFDQLWRVMRCFNGLPECQERILATDPHLEPLLRAPLGGRSLRERLPARCDPCLLELLTACLRPDPRTRPTAAELLQLPYFWSVPRLIEGTSLQHIFAQPPAVSPPPVPSTPSPPQLPPQSAATATATGQRLPQSERAPEVPQGAHAEVPATSSVSQAPRGVALAAAAIDAAREPTAHPGAAAAPARSQPSSAASQAAPEAASHPPTPPTPDQEPPAVGSAAAAVKAPAGDPGGVDARRDAGNAGPLSPCEPAPGHAIGSRQSRRAVACLQEQLAASAPGQDMPPVEGSASAPASRLLEEGAAAAAMPRAPGADGHNDGARTLTAPGAAFPGGSAAGTGTGTGDGRPQATDRSRPHVLPASAGLAHDAKPYPNVPSPRKIAELRAAIRAGTLTRAAASDTALDRYETGMTCDGVEGASGDSANSSAASQAAAVARTAWPYPASSRYRSRNETATGTGGLLDSSLAVALVSAGGGGGGAYELPSVTASMRLLHCTTTSFDANASETSLALAKLRAGPPAPGLFRPAATPEPGRLVDPPSSNISAAVDAHLGTWAGNMPPFFTSVSNFLLDSVAEGEDKGATSARAHSHGMGDLGSLPRRAATSSDLVVQPGLALRGASTSLGHGAMQGANPDGQIRPQPPAAAGSRMFGQRAPREQPQARRATVTSMNEASQGAGPPGWSSASVTGVHIGPSCMATVTAAAAALSRQSGVAAVTSRAREAQWRAQL
ncbi:hypothetical protein GPECTOR_21g736 [Gonium pectorale]|uniref:cyclin-dependent kinase n=1 Tax=Gonium pectorale TaxID=33097 RepID=A0A150GJ81_GONPE|nr:hypothetical protein GPECTOR_21g736 [Gonium pectorale]|eukprot:KXZ49510.1 hypothetical protein GPECTOR_21g736 [Gonium pectorale]